MRKYFSALFTLVHFFVLFHKAQGLNTQTTIVNGDNAYKGQFPYMVSVRYKNTHNCGGTIIASKWVLTAAHCLFPGYDALLSILYGTIYLQNGERRENNTVAALRSIVHENYQSYGGYENDIALIELEKELNFSSAVAAVKIKTERENVSDDEGTTSQGNIIGWGYNDTKGAVSDVLQYATISVFPDDYCLEYNSTLINPSVHVCAGLLYGGKGQCTGDSGGPLVVRGFQIGIVSWSGKPCASAGNPGIFTRVSTYSKWIQEKTGIIFDCST